MSGIIPQGVVIEIYHPKKSDGVTEIARPRMLAGTTDNARPMRGRKAIAASRRVVIEIARPSRKRETDGRTVSERDVGNILID